MEKKSQLSVKNRRSEYPAIPWSSFTFVEYAKHATAHWADVYLEKPEKELTEKQLFTKLKKELKELTIKLN